MEMSRIQRLRLDSGYVLTRLATELFLEFTHFLREGGLVCYLHALFALGNGTLFFGPLVPDTHLFGTRRLRCTGYWIFLEMTTGKCFLSRCMLGSTVDTIS